jgi:hypothetical protein
MPVLLGLLGLGVVLLLARWYAEADTRRIKASLRWTGFSLGLVLVVGLAATGRLPAALAFLAALIAWAWRVFGMVRMAHGLGRAFGLFGGSKSQGQGPQTPRPASGQMDEAEALRILGVKAGASRDEIKAAYRRLMAQVHPDRGGSDYFAAKLNNAKDVLLKE